MNQPHHKRIKKRRHQNKESGMTLFTVILLVALVLGTIVGIGSFLKPAIAAPAVSVQVQTGSTNAAGDITLKMIQPRYGHQATTLADGRVLITGGYLNLDPNDLQPATVNEVFDPATGLFTVFEGALPEYLGPVAPEANAIDLTNAGVLSFGIDNATFSWEDIIGFRFVIPATAETPEEIVEVPVPADANLDTLKRAFATATPLNHFSIYDEGNGAHLHSYNRVLVTGGLKPDGQPADAAVFNPARLATDKDDYVPGEVVFLNGSGWKPGEEVSIWVVDDRGWEFKSTVTANEAGKFPYDEPLFDVIEQHLGVTFDLTAIGAESGMVSTVRFTDAPGNQTLSSIAAGAQNGVLTYGSAAPAAGGTATFALTGTLAGSGGKPTVTYSVTAGLPAGATAPSVIGSGGNPQNATIRVNIVATTPPGTYVLTFSGTDDNSPANTRTTTGTLTIGPKSVTITAVSTAGKEYDGTTSATVSGGTVVGVINGDTVTAVPGAGSTFSSKNVGNRSVTVSGYTLGGSGASRYTLSAQPTAPNANITARLIEVTAVNNTKAYDGTTSSLATPSVTSGTIVTAVGDSANFIQTYDNKHVGNNKTLTPSGSVSDGNSGNNYSVTFVSKNAGSNTSITPRSITVTAATNSKVYDGTTSAGATPTVTTGSLVAGDTGSFTESYADKNVGTGKTLIPAGSVNDGNGGLNYAISFANNTTGAITAKALTVSATGVNKVYDGTTTATVTLSDNRISGDVLTASYTSATFANDNVGTGKTVSVTGISISGTDAGNYTANTTASTFANITARPITVTAATNTKQYDGTTSAAAIPTITVGTLGSGDTANFTETYSTKTVGTGKTLIPAGTVTDGNSGNNYAVTFVNDTSGEITAKSLTVSATGVNKVYDGTTAATVTLSDNRVAGDVLTTAYTSATFTTDKNVGTAKPVSVTGISISGTDSGNYTANTTASATANITALAITVTAATNTKTYDGNTTAAAIPTITVGTLVGGDTANFTESYSTAAAENGKTLTPAGSVSDGNSGLNYAVSFVNNTTGVINQKTLTAAIVGNPTKVYDGDTAVALTPATFSITGLVGSETLIVKRDIGAFNSPDVTTATTIVASLSNGHFDEGPLTSMNNYDLPTSASGPGTITALGITGNFTASNKVYDGDNSATVLTRTLSGVVKNDDVTLTGGTATFSDANVANGKTVTLTGATLAGAAASNYSLTSVNTTTANITAKTLTASIIGNPTKVYDGNTSATLASINYSLSGLIGSESFTVTKTSGSYNSADVASATTVSTTLAPGDFTAGAGTSASNYTLPISASGPGTITKAAATITVTPYDVTYDGNSHTATGTAKGVLNEDLTGLDLGATTHTDAGIYSGDAWTFTDSTGNYNNDNGAVDNNIDKADAVVTVTGYTGTYDAAAHGATGTATGVGGVDLSGGLNLGASFTDVPGGTANWTFEGGTNYEDESGTTAIVINKADATIVVNGYTGVYDGNPHGATGTATGVNNTDLSTSLNLGNQFSNVPGGTATWTFDAGGNYNTDTGTAEIVISKATANIVVNGYTGVYDGDPHGASGTATGVNDEDLTTSLNLGAQFTNVPGGTATWTFDAGINYNTATGPAEIVISKATANIVVNGYTGVYDGNPNGASGTATGVNDEDLTTSLNLGAQFTNVPGGTADWSFDAGGNYNTQSGSVNIEITKANATVSVSGYSGVYDGNEHGATGTATGVNGANLFTSLDLGEKFSNVPGGAADWSFDAGGNYNTQSGSVNIEITKANATVSVTGYTSAYDGNAHGASGTAKGVNNEPLSGLDLGAQFTNVPGGTANWTFTDVTGNYNDDSGTAAIVISKANAVIDVDGYTGVYDGNAHGATGTATGVKSETLAGLSLGSSFTDVPGGTANWTFTDVTGNYNSDSGTAPIVISKANAVIDVDGYTGVYDGNAHGATGTATGVKSETLAGLSLGASFTDVPGGTANWTFTDVTGNYNNDSGTAPIVITPATAIIVVNGYIGVYDGLFHGASLGSATGVNGENLASSVTVGSTTYKDVPGGSVAWSFANNNYVSQSGSVVIDINYGTFTGFFQPVDNLPTMNKAKAGSAIPVKFSLNGSFGLDIFAPGFPGWIQIVGGTGGDDIEETVTALTSSLHYDATANQYIYVWKTDKALAGKSVELIVKLKDGSEHRARFTFMR